MKQTGEYLLDDSVSLVTWSAGDTHQWVDVICDGNIWGAAWIPPEAERKDILLIAYGYVQALEDAYKEGEPPDAIRRLLAALERELEG